MSVLSALQLTCTYSLRGSLPLHCSMVRALHDTFKRSLQPLLSRYKQHTPSSPTHLQLWIRLTPQQLRHLRANSFSIYIASIIVVTNLRPPATPQHTDRDSQLDPVCTMTRILNIPIGFLHYLHSLLVSPSHSSIVPALTFGHQHCALVSRVLYTVTTSALLCTNYLHIVSRRSQTSLVRTPQPPIPHGQPCYHHLVVNPVTITSRSTLLPGPHGQINHQSPVHLDQPSHQHLDHLGSTSSTSCRHLTFT